MKKAKQKKTPLKLSRKGPRLYEGELAGSRVRLQGELMATHGAADPETTQTTWRAFVDGVEIGRSPSMSKARGMAYDACVKLPDGSQSGCEGSKQAAYSTDPKETREYSVTSNGEFLDRFERFMAVMQTLGAWGASRTLKLYVDGDGADRPSVEGLSIELDTKVLNREGDHDEIDVDRIAFKAPKQAARRRASTIRSIDTEGNEGSVRATSVKDGDRVRFRRPLLVKQDGSDFEVRAEEMGEVIDVDPDGPTLRVVTEAHPLSGEGLTQGLTMWVPAEGVVLVLSSEDPRSGVNA